MSGTVRVRHPVRCGAIGAVQDKKDVEAWDRSCALLKALLVGPRPYRAAPLRCAAPLRAMHAARRLAARVSSRRAHTHSPLRLFRPPSSALT